MSQLWVPGMSAGPLEDFVERLQRQIARFAEEAAVERAYVVVELVDGSRFALDSVSAEPGFGFVTFRPHPEEEEDLPAEVIVPVGAIKRIELDRAAEERARLGFSPPNA
jgi:hypothetical protein